MRFPTQVPGRAAHVGVRRTVQSQCLFHRLAVKVGFQPLRRSGTWQPTQHLHQRRQFLQARLTKIELHPIGNCNCSPTIGVGVAKEVSSGITAMAVAGVWPTVDTATAHSRHGTRSVLIFFILHVCGNLPTKERL